MNAPKRLFSPSFRDGFFAGLAAPVLLFADFSAPEPVIAPEPTLSKLTDMESIAEDWRRVGGDLRTAIARHGEAA